MDTEKTIFARVKKMANLLDRVMARTKSNLEQKMDVAKVVSPIQGRIILYLYSEADKRDIHQKDLEAHFDIRGSTVAVILKKMQANKLVTREISATDERMKTVKLTQRARELYPEALAEVKRAEKQLTKGLSKQEIDTFNKVLDKMAENISS